MNKYFFAIITMLLGFSSSVSSQSIYGDRFGLGSTPCMITSGSGTPSGGGICDIYVNTSSGDLWTKLTAGWTPVSILVGTTQPVNTVLAGPSSGGPAVPTFRSLVTNDIPTTLNGTSFTGAVDVAGHFTPASSDSWDFGSSTKLWRKGYISELSAILFTKQTQTLYGGWLAVSKNAGTFAAAVSSGDTTINFGQSMTLNQFILVRSIDTGGTPTEEYIKVGSNVAGTTYNVTRNLSGLGAKNWPMGTAYQVRGVTGDGWLELNAYDTPRMSVFTQGSAYNNSTENVRVGHLTGMPNSVSGIGLYAGDASNYLYYDGSNFKLKSASASIDSNGMTVVPDSTIFSNGTAYKWTRPAAASSSPTNCTSNNTGDKFGAGAFDTSLSSTTEFSEIDIHNVMKGGVTGGCLGRAFVELNATGWNSTVAHTAVTLRIGSDPSNPVATGVSISSGASTSLTVGQTASNDTITLTAVTTLINGLLKTSGSTNGLTITDRGNSNTSSFYRTSNVTRLSDSSGGDTIAYDANKNTWFAGSIGVNGSALTLSNGRNDNVAIGNTSFIKSISGITGAFSISGIVPPATADGQFLTILHNTGSVLTINHNDANSSAANRIFCPGSVNLSTSATFGTVLLQYDAAIPGWIVLSIK